MTLDRLQAYCVLLPHYCIVFILLPVHQPLLQTPEQCQTLHVKLLHHLQVHILIDRPGLTFQACVRYILWYIGYWNENQENSNIFNIYIHYDELMIQICVFTIGRYEHIAM